MKIIPLIQEGHGQMTAWRRDIHAHPELGFEETRTADLVARQLESFGIEVHRGVGRTGVVGVLRHGSSDAHRPARRHGRAARSRRPTPSPTARTPGDARLRPRRPHRHAAGCGRYLALTRRFDGTVNFIFQPAEEGLGGAKAMLADGLFQRFPCDACSACTTGPSWRWAASTVRSGPMMAGGAFFDIDITGMGAHGARPESGVDR
jgi:metal-dependent amidase/aminoacylase/carboxypeptidase family protein